MLIGNAAMSERIIEQAATYLGDVLKRAISPGSANLFLVRNHPGDDPTPSQRRPNA
jgi:DNA repair protein RadC